MGHAALGCSWVYGQLGRANRWEFFWLHSQVLVCFRWLLPMNMIKFECPHCRKIIEGDESLYGQISLCPQCQGELQVPQRPVDQGPKLARLITGPGSTPSARDPDAEEEKTIFEMSPSSRAFLGQMGAGIVLGLGGLAIAALGYPTQWLLGLGLVMLLAGVIAFLATWFKTKSAVYRLTTQRLLVNHGYVAKHLDELELYRVTDVTVDQSFWERLWGYGTVIIMTADTSTPRVELTGVLDPLEIKETIRIHYRAARKQEGMHPTEFIKPA
jgi:membrane protein YdbS with pleckstrin-like domain